MHKTSIIQFFKKNAVYICTCIYMCVHLYVHVYIFFITCSWFPILFLYLYVFFFIGYHTFIIHFFTCSSGPQNRLSQKHTVLVLDLEVYKKTQTVLYKELLKLRYTSKSTVLAVKFGGLGTILWRS